MNSHEFIHPEDEMAMRNLEGVPGFDTVARFILEHFTENLLHGLYMAQMVRISPTQLPEIYNLLPPICGKFGIDLPELYLTRILRRMPGQSATRESLSCSPVDSWII